MTCRICYEDGDLISPCACTGTMAHVHKECLEKWIAVSHRSTCELCHTPFDGSLVRLPSLLTRWRSSPLAAYAFIAFVLGVSYAVGSWVDMTYVPAFHWQMFVSCLLFNLAFLCLWATAVTQIHRGFFVTGVWFVTFGAMSTILHAITQNLHHPNLVYAHIVNLVIACACLGSEHVLNRCI